jgi:HAD superfamily hydrolase (TIGR01509 family)
MDGLMFNTEDLYTEAGTELLGRRGHSFTNELKDAMMGLQARASFQKMIDYCSLTETWEQLAVESNEIFIGLLGHSLQPMPGLITLLDSLEEAGIPKGIATSSCRALTDPCLSPFDLHSRFQFILTAENIQQGKPDPEIYLTAARLFGIAPAEMMVLEDSHNGCRAAHAAGAFAVAVPSASSRTHDFSMATMIVESLADPRIYKALGIARP